MDPLQGERRQTDLHDLLGATSQTSDSSSASSSAGPSTPRANTGYMTTCLATGETGAEDQSSDALPLSSNKVPDSDSEPQASTSSSPELPTEPSTPHKSYFPTNPDIIDEICEYLTVAYLHPDPDLLLEDRHWPSSEDGNEDGDDASPDATPTLPTPISPMAIMHRTRQTLLSTALTCKRLLEPALDRLWRHLDSLFPLLKLLPAFVRTDGTWVLRGPITQAHWTRFDYYALRVRAFTFTRDPDTLDIAMHVYFRLAQLRAAYIPPISRSPYSSTIALIHPLTKGLPLLPNLHHLHCPCTSQTDFLISGICLFLSPSLRSLKFEGISSVEDKLCGTVLYELLGENADGEYVEPSGVQKPDEEDEEDHTSSKRHHSSLECITLRGRGLSYDTLRMIPRFSHLKILALEGMGDALTSTVLKGLGQLESLRVLGLDFAGVNWDDVLQTKSKGSQDENESTEFRDLQSLALIAPLGVVHSFLKRLSTKALESISVESPQLDPQSLVLSHPRITKIDKETFLTYLASTWSNSLRRLELVLQPRDDDGSEFDQPLGVGGPIVIAGQPPQMPFGQPQLAPPPGNGGWMAPPPVVITGPPLNNNGPNPQPNNQNGNPPPPLPIIIQQPPPLPVAPGQNQNQNQAQNQNAPAPPASRYSNPNTLTLNTFGPLLRMTKLTHLRIEGYPMSLSDEDIKEMAGCWSGLVELELPFISSSMEGSNELKKPTAKSLATIAKSCWNLESLKLSLNLDGVSSIPLPSVTSKLSSSSHRLTHISLSPPSSFSSSPTFAPHHTHDDNDGVFELRDLLHLARHIDTCFPSVNCISVFDGLSSSGVGEGLLGSGSFWRDSFKAEDDSGYGGTNDFAGVYSWERSPERWHALRDTVRMYQGVRRDAVRVERRRTRMPEGS